MGGGRQAARHGARAQREAAGGRREAGQHRRVVGARPARIRQGGEQGQLRRGGLRARRAGDPGGAAAQGRTGRSRRRRRSRRPRISSPTCAARRRRRAPQPNVVGNPDAALAGAAKVVEAEYDVPFQGHTAFGPAHAMADPSNDQMTIYSNDMKSYGLRNGVARVPADAARSVRVVWMEGPQGYGRTAADDAGFEAAFLAKEIGRPVRVQWMRHEETAWDTKGPAFACQDARRARCAGQPRRARLRRARRRPQSPRLQRARHRADRAADGHAARRRRRAAAPPRRRRCTRFPNRRMATHVVSLPLVWETPLRTGNLRDPNGPQVTFASESFIDELAAAAKADPVEFRLKLLTASTADDSGFKRARSIAVVKAAAEAYGWDTRPSPKPRGTGEHPHRARHRLRLPQPDRRRADRRGRGESPDRPRLGEAARLRARLRAGDQSRRRCAARSRAACCTR